MAKRTRASARRPRKSAPGRHTSATGTYSVTLLANGRRRFERTEESVASIAADFSIRPFSMRRLAKRLGWVRYEQPPRDLPAAARLLAQVEELEVAALAVDHHLEAQADVSAENDVSQRGEPEAQKLAASTDELPPVAETVNRVYRAVLEEVAAIESLRARLKREPLSAVDAERTARTLSNLTETLQKLQRLQCAVPQSGLDYDDMPADIDEFRNELARQIEVFVASRANESDAGGAPPMLDAIP